MSVLKGQQIRIPCNEVRGDCCFSRLHPSAHQAPVPSRGVSAEQIAEIRQPIIDKYESESTPYYSGARLWDDGILGMPDTRQALGLGIAASLNAEIPDQQYGVFRM